MARRRGAEPRTAGGSGATPAPRWAGFIRCLPAAAGAAFRSELLPADWLSESRQSPMAETEADAAAAAAAADAAAMARILLAVPGEKSKARMAASVAAVCAAVAAAVCSCWISMALW